MQTDRKPVSSKQDFSETGGTICLPHRFQSFFDVPKSAIPARQNPLVPDLRYPPERENTTGILHRSALRFTRQTPLWQTGRADLSGQHVFERKNCRKVQKTDGPTRHPQKKYRRKNNEIHAQPAWSLASRILRQKRNNNPVFYDFLED